MTTPIALTSDSALLDAIPIGLCIYDAQRRFVMANAPYFDIVGLPYGSLRPGSTLEANMGMLALRGVFGPGEAQRELAEILQHDYSTVLRVRRHQPSGRMFDTTYSPLRGGGHVVSVIETTSIMAMRDAAQAEVDRLHIAFDGMNIGLAIFGADRCLSFQNRRFAELMGVPGGKLRQGVGFADMLQILQDCLAYVGHAGEAFLTSQMASDRSQRSTVRQQRASGQVIDVQSDPLPCGGWTMTVSDISALVQAEDEARRRAGMLDGIVQHIPHGIAVFGPDRRVTMVNAAYDEIMKGAEIAIGDHVYDIVARRAAAGEYDMGDTADLLAKPYRFDPNEQKFRRLRRPNGTTIDMRRTPLPDGGHLSVITDVTALITAEAELARRANEMGAMLANIRHGIVLWDREQRIVACNSVAEQLLLTPPGLLQPGRTLEDTIRSALDRGNLGVGQIALDSADRLRRLDRSRSHQDQRLTRTGRVLEVRTDPTPDGGFVTTYTDVTSIRQAEEALHQARRAAESANTAKSRFLAAMSHELRTPLTTVIASAEAIMRASDGPGSGHILDAAEAAHTAGRQLVSMIDTILDVARLEAGRFDLANDPVDLQHLVRSCVKQSDAAAAAAEVQLAVDLPHGLPAVRGDARRLRQALHHLVANAVKFTDAGGQARITVQYEQPGGDLLLKVSDTGIGIAEADLDRVFEPFAQVESPLNGVYPGSGLGLYVSRALMRAHGGELLLRSRPGEGTTAVMRIPSERLHPVAADLSEDVP